MSLLERRAYSASHSDMQRCPVALWRRSPISVLVVSDRAEDMEPALSQLREQLFDVAIVHRGWDAYYRVLSAMPCVLLVDAEMTTMDSLTLCRLVRRMRLLPRMGLIMASRNNDEKLRLEALALGVLDVLPMPLDPQELMPRISTHRRATVRNCDATPECRMRDEVPRPPSAMLRTLMDQIDRSGGMPGPTRDLAKNVGASERRLAEVFKAEMGEPLAVYLRRLRMRAACRLLSRTMIPIKEISARAGFGSPCNFTVAFRQSVGMSPSRFRAENSRASCGSAVDSRRTRAP